MITDMKSVTITLNEGGTFVRRFNIEDGDHEDGESAEFTFDSTRQMARALTRAAMELWAWLDGCLIKEKKEDKNEDH